MGPGYSVDRISDLPDRLWFNAVTNNRKPGQGLTHARSVHEVGVEHLFAVVLEIKDV